MNIIEKCSGIKDLCRKWTGRGRLAGDRDDLENQRKYTACCGLYCLDCMMSRRELFATARTLERLLDDVAFDQYAKVKANSRAIFDDYNLFQKMIREIQTLECSSPCSEGGCKPNCPIRECAKGNGYEGCWECGTAAECGLLEPLKKLHGRTIVRNLELIRRHGPDDWADKRGPHYPWSKLPEDGGEEGQPKGQA